MNDSLDEPMLKYQRGGFTIVELLIVIIVIAILAAITTVAFTGIRERAGLSALQSELSGQARLLANYRAQNNDQYPATLAAARTAGMLNNTSSAEYTKYTVNNTTNPANYGATGVRGGLSYSVSSTGSVPMNGACVTNLVANPGLENAGNAWQGWAGSGSGTVTFSRPQNGGHSGSAYHRATWSGTNSSGGVAANVAPVSAGTQYTSSMWVRASKAAMICCSWQGGGSATQSFAVTANEWRRVSCQGVTPSGSSSIQLNAYGDSMVAAEWRDGDDAMITEGSTLYAYGDGDSAGWFWNGTPHNSTSTGPAVTQ